ncbi:DUF2690 domain-containing protein [Streptomyces minutiscleroticus]|uniref:DUF2690 domain-containing protein n=1 Tax=Streptomyces minutiscleroticus TaxID=68238 RepID=UPI00332DD122
MPDACHRPPVLRGFSPGHSFCRVGIAPGAPVGSRRPGRRNGRPSPAGHRTVALMAVLATVCAVAVGGVAVVLLLLTRDHGEPQSSVTPSASSAQPRCRGAACEGRSPMATKRGARPDTLTRRRMATGAWMEVRYSRRCGTSWARTWGARRRPDRDERGRRGTPGPPRRDQG